MFEIMEAIRGYTIYGHDKKNQVPDISEIEKLRARNEYLEAENALLKKVKALVEARDARLRETGQKPSEN